MEEDVNKNKSLIAFIMVLALVALQIGVAYAAPAQVTIPDGTIVSVTQSTDSMGNTVFDVVIKDSTGTEQTVTLTPAEAEAAGLVTANTDGTFTIKAVAGDKLVGGQLQANPCTSTSGGSNPVAAAISAFFCGIEGTASVVDTSISQLHSEGFGYGEIAQACFMADVLKTTCSAILDAKQSKDFTTLDNSLTAAGFSCSPTNWGQLKKCALSAEVKSLTNLGAIMSGRATAPSTGTGNGNGHGNGNGNGNGHGNGGGNGNGHGHNP